MLNGTRLCGPSGLTGVGAEAHCPYFENKVVPAVGADSTRSSQVATPEPKHTDDPKKTDYSISKVCDILDAEPVVLEHVLGRLSIVPLPSNQATPQLWQPTPYLAILVQ